MYIYCKSCVLTTVPFSITVKGWWKFMKELHNLRVITARILNFHGFRPYSNFNNSHSYCSFFLLSFFCIFAISFFDLRLFRCSLRLTAQTDPNSALSDNYAKVLIRCWDRRQARILRRRAFFERKDFFAFSRVQFWSVVTFSVPERFEFCRCFNTLSVCSYIVILSNVWCVSCVLLHYACQLLSLCSVGDERRAWSSDVMILAGENKHTRRTVPIDTLSITNPT